MKKKILTLGIISATSSIMMAQVGINTPAPTATLDVTAKNATGTTSNVDGLLVPRVDRQRAQSMTGVPTSTLVFINSIGTGTQTGTTVNVDATGYYYFNGTVWTKLNGAASTPVNIYNADGALTGNRVVTQNANTLAFNGTATNAFSVDGSTFSVDAANNRVGVGTTAPGVKLDVAQPIGTSEATQFRIINTSPVAANNTALMGFNSYNGGGATWGIGAIQNNTSQINSNFNILYSGGASYLKFVTIKPLNPGTGATPLFGIGTETPQKTAHINGSLQITNELNVGGNATTAGSAGAIGQILTSNGAGMAPTWQAASVPAAVNIYNADGALTGNRVVTQGANTLAFNGTATNAFSVDGNTFSVDAANDRVGIGTITPVEKVDIKGALVANGKSNVDKTASVGLDYFTGQSRILSWGPDATTNGIISFWNGLGGGGTSERMRIDSNGNLGIGTTSPQKTAHINGSLQITNELNVGGNATTAGSAGAIGQILTSNGAGMAPTWQAASVPAAVNIYNADGTLTGNRVVTQNANTLAFNGTATNAFSVDGSTFSVDAANNRIGLGTTAPSNKIDMGTDFGTGMNDVEGKKLAIFNSPAGDYFYGLGVGAAALQFHTASPKNGAPKMVLMESGNLGIGTTAPTAMMDVVGNPITAPLRARNIENSSTTVLAAKSTLTPVMIDQNGVMVQQQTPIKEYSNSYNMDMQFAPATGVATTIFTGINSNDTIVKFKFLTNFAFGDNNTSGVYGELSYSTKRGWKVNDDWTTSGDSSAGTAPTLTGVGTNTLTFDFPTQGDLVFSISGTNLTVLRTSGPSSFLINIWDGLKMR